MEKKKSIVKDSASISAIILLGKVLGFVKQAVIAWAFGSNALTDIYFAADGYTSMFGQVMSQSVGPTVLTQYVKLSEEGKQEEAKRLVRNSYLFFSVLSVSLIIISIIFSRQICNLIGISYSPEQKEELRFFLITLCPVILFTAMIGVSSGYLSSHNRFLPGRLTSLFFSVCIIVSIILFKDALGLRALLYGFLLGYILHMLLMLGLVVPKVGIGFGNPFKSADFRSMIKRFVPLVVGVSVVDFGHLVDKVVASSLESGSVSALHYGQVISSDIVNAVFITSVGVVLLTSITRSVASNTETSKLISQIKTIMCTMTFISGCLSVLYFVEGQDLIKMFFERGSFDSRNTVMVASVASFYAIGFVFMANREVLIKTHYAFHDTVSPMINSIVGVIVNLIGSIALSKFMGIAGVALATSLSLLTVFLMSLFTLKKHIHNFIIDKECGIDFMKTASAMVVTCVIGKVCSSALGNIHFLIRMIFVGILMVIVYAVMGTVLYETTMVSLTEKILAKIGKDKPMSIDKTGIKAVNPLTDRQTDRDNTHTE